MKGKPWTVAEEKQLRALIEAKLSLSVIAKRLRKPEEAVRQKIRRLGLEVVEQSKIVCSTTSRLVLPKELPSVEESLKILVAVMEELKTPGLSKTEIMRLRTLVQTSSLYQRRVAEYVDYRGLEAELLDLREKYVELAKKSKGASAK